MIIIIKKYSMSFLEDIKLVIQNALLEDVGAGDYTSLACVPGQHIGKAQLIVKDKGIIAGVVFAIEIFKYVDPTLKIKVLILCII